MTSDSVGFKVRQYILQNFVFEENAHLGDNQSLLTTGVVDSTGILDLIAFAEAEFKIRFEDSELVADNFDSINRVTACITRKFTNHSSPLSATT